MVSPATKKADLGGKTSRLSQMVSYVLNVSTDLTDPEPQSPKVLPAKPTRESFHKANTPKSRKKEILSGQCSLVIPWMAQTWISYSCPMSYWSHSQLPFETGETEPGRTQLWRPPRQERFLQERKPLGSWAAGSALALGTSSRTLVVGATCVVVVKEVSRCGGGTGSAGADGADGGRGGRGGRGGGTGGGGTGDPLIASLALARLDGLCRASPSSELCRRRVSCRSRKPRRPNMVIHPPSSSPAAEAPAAESMGTQVQTDRHHIHMQLSENWCCSIAHTSDIQDSGLLQQSNSQSLALSCKEKVLFGTSKIVLNFRLLVTGHCHYPHWHVSSQLLFGFRWFCFKKTLRFLAHGTSKLLWHWFLVYQGYDFY